MMNIREVQPATERVLDSLDPIDAALGTDHIYGSGGKRSHLTDEMRLSFTVRAIEHHRNHNVLFDRYCEKVGFSTQKIGSDSDLAVVPLLPTGLFKRHPSVVLSGGVSEPIIPTTSSGTHGTISTVPRDDVTIMRFFSSVAIGKRELLGVETFDRQVFNLTPSSREFPNLWIAYVMQGISVLYTTRSYVHAGVIELKRLVADLRKVLPGEEVNIVGPPPVLLDLAIYLNDQPPLKLGPESLVITIGGWKRREGEKIPREKFDREIGSALGIDHASNIRDAYNMVEINTVIFECKSKVKHCPPWMTVRARDSRTLESLPSGQSGLLSFLDPTSLSYPGFVLSDDFGKVEHQAACSCGIVGDTVSIERRVNRVEARGCALKLETLTSDTASKVSVTA